LRGAFPNEGVIQTIVGDMDCTVGELLDGGTFTACCRKSNVNGPYWYWRFYFTDGTNVRIQPSWVGVNVWYTVDWSVGANSLNVAAYRDKTIRSICIYVRWSDAGTIDLDNIIIEYPPPPPPPPEMIGITILDCQIYLYKAITGLANDIIGEEVVGEGLYWDKKLPAS